MALGEVSSKCKFYSRLLGGEKRNNINDLKAVNRAFSAQFEASCASFKRLAESNPSRLRIRFFSGDAIAFCMGLRQLREPEFVPNCYLRPGSTIPLVVDGEDQPSTSDSRTPTKFNVIETGYLVDRIGILNLLPNVINALEGLTSVLYTWTRVEKIEDERNLLEKLLCGDVSVMWALLGVVHQRISVDTGFNHTISSTTLEIILNFHSPVALPGFQ